MIPYEEWKYSNIHTRMPGNEAYARFFEAQKQVFTDELKGRPDVAAFLEAYDPKSVENFLSRYADEKLEFIRGGRRYFTEILEAPARKPVTKLPCRDYTENAFRNIVQKKLYNMECLWRAGRITIPDIAVTDDFNFWVSHAEVGYRLVPEVTDQDIALMQQYLQVATADISEWLYHGYHAEYNYMHPNGTDYEKTHYPEWFRYYDEQMSTGYVQTLPDLRTPKEKDYYDKYYALVWKPAPAAPPADIQPRKPTLYLYGDTLRNFAQQYDDPCFAALVSAKVRLQQEAENYERADDAVMRQFDILSFLDPLPYPPGGMDWRESLQLCCNAHLAGHIAEELETVYEEYLERRRQMPAWTPDEYALQLRHRAAGVRRKQILEVRAFLGEPADFNF